jgi:hypothetical protein
MLGAQYLMADLQSPLEIITIIDLKFSKKSVVDAIMKALIPDNVNFPKGLSMQMFSKDNTLFIEFSSNNIEIGTLINTIDEVLNHISIAKKVITDA